MVFLSCYFYSSIFELLLWRSNINNTEVILMNTSTIKKVLSITAIIVATSGLSLSASAEVQPNSVKPPAIQKTVGAMVNINHATAKDMSISFKGIGLKKAEAIVAWREKNGKFTAIDQLLEVKGIGEKILALNKSQISL